MSDLADGTYDCIVVDTEVDDKGGARIDLTITAGPRKGETLSLRASKTSRDPIELLGLPATLEVRDGAPSVRW